MNGVWPYSPYREWLAALWGITLMRYASRVGRIGENSNVFPIRPSSPIRHENEELTAFRGFLLAASASAVIWGLCLAALWLTILRT